MPTPLGGFPLQAGWWALRHSSHAQPRTSDSGPMPSGMVRGIMICALGANMVLVFASLSAWGAVTALVVAACWAASQGDARRSR